MAIDKETVRRIAFLSRLRVDDAKRAEREKKNLERQRVNTARAAAKQADEPCEAERTEAVL